MQDNKILNNTIDGLDTFIQATVEYAACAVALVLRPPHPDDPRGPAVLEIVTGKDLELLPSIEARGWEVLWYYWAGRHYYVSGDRVVECQLLPDHKRKERKLC